MAEAYGQAGREAYIRARFTFDLVWPLVYTIFLTTAISWLYQKAYTLESLWQRMNLVPVLAALFDDLENISTSLVMLRYPNHMPLVSMLASIFTVGKWILLGTSFVLLIVGVVIGVYRWLKKKPIAQDAYDELAEAYAAMVDTKPHNAYYERPATLSFYPM